MNVKGYQLNKVLEMLRAPEIEKITVWEAYEKGLLENVSFRVSKKSKNKMISYDYNGQIKEISVENAKSGRYTFG